MQPGARVALGMSGGVDSSVAARLLMDAGFDVVGVTCVFVDDENTCRAVEDARMVAERLGVPHVVKDCTDRFACAVVDPFVDEYAQGRTPSPCVACNRSCKIPSLVEAADGLGCRFVATGHYARIVRRGDRLAVARSAFAAKDQSYMLSMLSQEQLARLVLPLGSIAEGKARVRKLAAQWGLPVASKSDSQDICFIQGSHLDFLADRGLVGDPGNIVTADGRVVGRHKGLHRYTIGQRKGLDIGGAPEPYYVVDKRAHDNELVVAFASGASIAGVLVSDLVWQGEHASRVLETLASGGSYACSVKLRYRQAAAACRVTVPDAAMEPLPGEAVSKNASFVSALEVVLDEPQATTAPGQYAVLYDGDAVVAAGVIEALRHEALPL